MRMFYVLVSKYLKWHAADDTESFIGIVNVNTAGPRGYFAVRWPSLRAADIRISDAMISVLSDIVSDTQRHPIMDFVLIGHLFT